jgi:hypothetical protein
MFIFVKIDIEINNKTTTTTTTTTSKHLIMNVSFVIEKRTFKYSSYLSNMVSIEYIVHHNNTIDSAFRLMFPFVVAIEIQFMLTYR